MRGRWRQAFHMVWAMLVGASVTLQLCVAVVLNRRSSKPSYHAFYVSNIAVFNGGLMLLPLALLSKEPYKRPARWWSLLGGVWGLPAFFGIPAGAMLGIQIVLLCQLLAMLSTALLFDIRRGGVRMTDYTRLAGFGVVLAGVALDNVGASSTGVSFSPLALLLLAGVFAAGVGYALQAKFNARLSRDVGGTARATVICALVTVASGLPVDGAIFWDLGVPLVVDPRDWYLWVFAGFQSAFYVGSLARLPKELGYTASYLALLVGKLLSSSLVDALGVTGKVVHFDWLRALSLALVVIGSALFTGAPLPCAGRGALPEPARTEQQCQLDEEFGRRPPHERLRQPLADSSWLASHGFAPAAVPGARNAVRSPGGPLKLGAPETRREHH